MMRSTHAALLAMIGLLFLFPISSMADVDPNVDATVAAALADPTLCDTLETECITTLQSDASWGERYRAARILAGAGTMHCVEPLSVMLTQPEKAQLARYALEPLPFPEVDAAFLKALETATGPERLGLVASIGHRRDANAIPALSGLLADQDAPTAEATARTLGAIGTPEAVAVLEPLLDGSPLGMAAAEGCLTAAEHMVRAGDTATAMRLYERLMADTWPGSVRAGAFTGILAADPEQATGRMMNAIGGEDPLIRGVAVAAIASLEGDDVTEHFADQLPTLPATLQAPLIEALALRDDPPTLDVLYGMLNSDGEAARIAALKVIADRGDTSAVAPLCAVLERSTSRAETNATMETLCRISGDETDKALIKAMEQLQAPHNAVLADVLARRGVTDAWHPIHRLLADESIRPVVFRALGKLARPTNLNPLLESMVTLQGDIGRTEAEESVAALCQRMSSATILNARYGAAPDGPWADVTDKVVALVAEGNTEVPANNSLFGDPAPNIPKTLRVEYEINANPGVLEAAEGQSLSLDLKAEPAEVVSRLQSLLDNTSSTETTASCLRVLGMVGGEKALATIEGKVGNPDPAVHDAAVRVLAGWPDASAVGTLVRVAATAPEANHRIIALRGSVRMLREGTLSPIQTLVEYDRLITVAQTTDERRAILAGLADVAHPAALAPVMTFLENEDLRAEAVLARDRILTALGLEAGQEFTSLYNGTSLEGWAGEPELWRVDGGDIVGESTPEHVVENNTFLTWEGGDVANFALQFRYKTDAESVNSGIQIRSERFEGFRVRGYQADIATDDWITGISYEEGGRGILARRGEMVEFTADGTRSAERFEEEEVLGQYIRPGEWNNYHVVAWGNQIVTRVNGHITHIVTDHAPEARGSGVLAFQLHVGPPMRIRYADISMLRLPDEAAQN